MKAALEDQNLKKIQYQHSISLFKDTINQKNKENKDALYAKKYELQTAKEEYFLINFNREKKLKEKNLLKNEVIELKLQEEVYENTKLKYSINNTCKDELEDKEAKLKEKNNKLRKENRDLLDY